MVGDCLVDDVPRGDAPRVAAHERLDVGDERAGHLAPGERRGEPARELPVPDERVAVDAHPVRLRERDELVRGVEAPPVLERVDRLPLHRVLGRDRVELAHERGGIVGVTLEEIGLDGGADRHARHRPQGTVGVAGLVRGSRYHGDVRNVTPSGMLPLDVTSDWTG